MKMVEEQEQVIGSICSAHTHSGSRPPAALLSLFAVLCVSRGNETVSAPLRLKALYGWMDGKMDVLKGRRNTFNSQPHFFKHLQTLF